MSHYRISVYYTPMSLPLSFTCHTWIEITKDTKTTRYDIWAYSGLPFGEQVTGYVYKNLFPNHLGTTVSPFASAHSPEHRQSGKIFSQIEGNDNSIAAHLYNAIEEKVVSYPYADSYNMIFGPTCNTFTQWLLDLVPNHTLSLPFNAWGKGNRVSSHN